AAGGELLAVVAVAGGELVGVAAVGEIEVVRLRWILGGYRVDPRQVRDDPELVAETANGLRRAPEPGRERAVRGPRALGFANHLRHLLCGLQTTETSPRHLLADPDDARHLPGRTDRCPSAPRSRRSASVRRGRGRSRTRVMAKVSESRAAGPGTRRRAHR